MFLENFLSYSVVPVGNRAFIHKYCLWKYSRIAAEEMFAIWCVTWSQGKRFINRCVQVTITGTGTGRYFVFGYILLAKGQRGIQSGSGTYSMQSILLEVRSSLSSWHKKRNFTEPKATSKTIIDISNELPTRYRNTELSNDTTGSNPFFHDRRHDPNIWIG